MKKIVFIAVALSMFLAFADSSAAQDKKAERKARRELRRQEKAIKDSLMMLMEGSDSVNVGYGYQKKNKMNSSVSRINGPKKTPVSYTTIADYIQGKVAGVMVQKSGDNVRYVIRGIGTNSDHTDPLLMIDGVEVDSFNSILPEQVESVEVIKDGSASIYGMRGANGVIMITTKKQ